MKKHYGQMVRSLMRLACLAGILLCASGLLSLSDGRIGSGTGEIGVGLGIFLYALYVARRRERDVKEYIGIVKHDNHAISGNVMQNFPLPIIVLHIDGDIVWYNDFFAAIFHNQNLFGTKLEAIVPSIKWRDLLKSSKSISRTVTIEDKTYLVKGEMVNNRRLQSGGAADEYSVYLFFIDKTLEEKMQRLYLEERTDVAIINIDNYDYLIQKANDIQNQDMLYKLNRLISDWVQESGGVVQKTDRDRYFVIFAHKSLEKYIQERFDILEVVRKLGEQMHLPVSVSLGIGTGGTITENEAYARSALEMALGRGGDQAAVKDETQYNFYGGRTGEYEKSTRVKTRAVSLALKDFILGVDRVILMGHRGLDYDCFGAAMGLQRAVRFLGKKPYVVVDNAQAIKKLFEEIRNFPEYDGMFIDNEQAMELGRGNSLVVVIDTHRPSMLPCPELLGQTDKVVLIDHHRRSTEFINPCSLVYHEPYASSTCEMVAEILQYVNAGEQLTTVEAECLYMGILMDTKNFIMKTGVRTFEAASYLRKHGLDTVEVKRMFNVDKEDYDHRVTIVKNAERVTDEISVAACYEKYPNIRVVASQAADEMLNIDDIQASFVVYPQENQVGISGRSLGGINVQLILERLGGGGHMSVAGAQIPDRSVSQVVEALKEAIISYVNEQ